MKLEITRRTGFWGATSKIKVFVDGEQVTQLATNETFVYETAAPAVKVKFSQFGLSSPEQVYQESSQLTVKMGTLFTALLGIAILCMILNGFMNVIILPIVTMVASLSGLVVMFSRYFKVEQSSLEQEN